MNAHRRLLSTLILVAVLVGCVALATPSIAGAGGSKCPGSCPPIKRLHGYPCRFVGCDVATGACAYAC